MSENLRPDGYSGDDMAYQDKWVKGKVVEKGMRECSDRYEIVRSFCNQFGNNHFSVCDIGANMNYFGLRLTEDFPDCTVVAFEYNNYEMRTRHLKKNDARRILLFNHKFTLPDLKLFSRCCHFDVVLALSVVHHLSESLDEWLKVMQKLGDNLIVEFAIDDSPRVLKRDDYKIPSNAVILGYGKSHKDKTISRPIVLIK